MANGKNLSPVQVELRSLGARPPVQYNYVAARPFLFGGIVTDDATTAADMTLTTGILDQELRANYGGTGSNPQIMVLIEAFHLSLETGWRTSTSTISRPVGARTTSCASSSLTPRWMRATVPTTRPLSTSARSVLPTCCPLRGS